MKKVKKLKKLFIGMVMCTITVLNITTAIKSNKIMNFSTISLRAMGESNSNEEGSGESTNGPCNYIRTPERCTITGNGKIKLLSGTILEVKGSLSIDGAIVCSTGGTTCCSMKECVDVYRWL